MRYIIQNDKEVEFIDRCEKCLSYRVYRDECMSCGDRYTFFEKNIIDNIEKYGFRRVFPFNIWKLGNIRIKSIKYSTNMTLRIKGRPDILINRYGDFIYFKKYLDRIIGIETSRNITINKLLS
jgi:hypothetical protein